MTDELDMPCPETSDAYHTSAWYDGGRCDACGQDGPGPDDEALLT